MISKYFKRKEFECPDGCKFDTVDVELMAMLEDLREHFDSPITITSGCRCLTHNSEVGGSSKSQHLHGKASDVIVKNVGTDRVYDYLDAKYPNSKGLGLANTFVHLDCRNKRARWTY